MAISSVIKINMELHFSPPLLSVGICISVWCCV